MRKNFLAVLFLAFGSLLIAQQKLNNEGVIKLIKAGLSDDVIAAAVSSSPGEFDTSADALVALKTAGAGDKIVAAVVSKASGAATPQSPQLQPVPDCRRASTKSASTTRTNRVYGKR